MKKKIYPNPDVTLLSGIFIVFLNIVFGANAVAIKIALTGIGPFTTAGIRFAIAAVAIAIWAKVTGQPFGLKKKQLLPLFIVSGCFTAQLSLFYFGLSKTLASRGVLIGNLLPFIVLFLCHFFIPGDRITVKKMVGIVLGFSGVVFIFANGHQLSGAFNPGDLIILGAVIIWSCNGVYTKTIIHAFAPFHVVLYPMIFSVPIFLIEGFLFDPAMIHKIDAWVIGSLAYQSLVCAAFGFVAWNTLLKKYGATTLHSFVFIMPISGVLFSGLVLKDPITSNILVAMLLITTGIMVIHFKLKKSILPLFFGRGI